MAFKKISATSGPEEPILSDFSPDPMVEETVNIPLVRSWIDECERKHGARCNVAEHQPNSTLDELRLIDVVDGRVVRAPENARYLALSYVWGGIPQLRLLRQNETELSAPESLLGHWDQIPRVIQDAIEFTTRLQERYLWVDSLCIMQDDERSKHHQILQMASVYNGSLATIVAAAGQDANNPLAGLIPGSREPEQKKLQYYNLYLVDEGDTPYTTLRKPKPGMEYRTLGKRLKPRQMNLVEKLATSPYEERAWTYQERLLSRRCLYFMDNMLYFHCRSCVRGENKSTPYSDNISDIRPLSLFGADPVFAGDPTLYPRTFGVIYAQVVTDFTRKKLSYPMDILLSFAGVMAAMEKLCSWKFVDGIPEQILDYALLWAPFSQSKRRQISNARGSLENAFSSWSWAGWYAESDYEHLVRVESGFEPFFCSTRSFVKSYYVCTEHGSRRLERSLELHAFVPVSSSEGTIEREVNNCAESLRQLRLHRSVLIFEVPVIPCRIVTKIELRSQKQPFAVRSQARPTDRTVIALKTNADFPCFLYGAEGLLLDDVRENCEIVILSVSKHPGLEETLWTEDNSDSNSYANIMLIRRLPGGYAERVTVGHIGSLPPGYSFAKSIDNEETTYKKRAWFILNQSTRRIVKLV